MRPIVLYVAGAGLLLALIDFPRSTVPLLQKARALVVEQEESITAAEARLVAQGIPPDAPTLQSLQSTLAEMHRIEASEESFIFRGAERMSDYLVRPEERPAELSSHAIDRLLSERLAKFAEGARSWPILLSPSVHLYDGILGEDDPVSELEGRLTRFLASAWTLRTLDAIESIELRRFKLQRPAGEPWQVEWTVAGGINEILEFWELFLSVSDDVPPRYPKEHRLRRLPPEEWGLTLGRFRSPPVELIAICTLSNPPAKGR